jgi:HEAT repeat protein
MNRRPQTLFASILAALALAASGCRDMVESPTPDDIPALAAVVRTDQWRREPAAAALAKLGSPATPVLVELLGDENAEVRSAAVGGLIALGPPATAAVAIKLGDQRAPRETRRAAFVVLVQLAERSPETIAPVAAAWQEALADEQVTPFDREQGLKILQDIDASRAAAVAGAWLAQADPQLRVAAARTLCKLGQREQDAARALGELLRHEAPQVRREAVLALGQCTGAAEEAARNLAAAMSDGDASVRRCAVVEIAELGNAARAALPQLETRLRDEPQVAVRAASAIRRLDAARYAELHEEVEQALMSAIDLRTRTGSSVSPLDPSARLESQLTVMMAIDLLSAMPESGRRLTTHELAALRGSVAGRGGAAAAQPIRVGPYTISREPRR